MGYWQCPRCGSREVFQGTEVVGSSGGTVTMTNEHGMSLSRSTGMETKQVQVIKCKACGEILSQEHNYFYTQEELAQIAAQRRKSEAKWAPIWWVLFVFFVLMALALLSATIAIAIGRGTSADLILLLILGLFCAGMAWYSMP